ncbi:hypothetical protein [Aliiroseovarius lamellibrachiae]|uniref:hypothetical protein n=1 Tax=Aliiroseovarius lamellibrachiae TaxID=1924933 RepID=UPI001BDF768F|nr:hypothetical protein [Aliiroseovarius lamellibrachiae]MBT2130106.1 hypothetical protein [Aliiroseovarius lamellibrachiae]
MDSAKQAEGEKQVREFLIKPLMNRGLAKPSSVKKDVFEEMLKVMCQKLAYMSGGGLAALEEEVASRVAASGKDRFPIANQICEWAGAIEKPSDSASPLIRSVFSGRIGRAALAEGWGPELLDQLKDIRRWPNEFVLKLCREKADDHIRRLRRLEGSLSESGALSPVDAKWRDGRLARLKWCEEIAAMGADTGGEA